MTQGACPWMIRQQTLSFNYVVNKLFDTTFQNGGWLYERLVGRGFFKKIDRQWK